ncbi:unnamed protein product, partial [Choristocarpus tenellus]
MCSAEPAEGGLAEFWSCLDPKQRDSLLTIHCSAVLDALDCDLCRDLLENATELMEEEAEGEVPPTTLTNLNGTVGGGKTKQKPKPKPKPRRKAVGLRLLEDGIYVPDFAAGMLKRQGEGFVKYMEGVFTVTQ